MYKGRARLGYADGDELDFDAWKSNLQVRTWFAAFGPLLLAGDVRYVASHMLFEYVNTGGSVTPPSFDEVDDIDYYLGITSDVNRDYLRVPILTTGYGKTDIDLAYNDILKFHSRSSGTAGVNARAFTAGAGSRVIGGGLVAAPVPADRTQDILIARWYAGSPKTKVDGSEISLDWELTQEALA